MKAQQTELLKKQKKEWLYKCPESQTAGEWRAWLKKIKEDYPIQYFFREVVRLEISIVLVRIRDFIYYLKCKFWYKYNILKLRDNPRWLDSDSKIELALQKILIDFVEKERLFEIINWESDKKHKEVKRFLNEAYFYYKHVKKELEKQLDDLLTETYGKQSVFDFLEEMENLDKNKELQRKGKQIDELEQRIFDNDTEFFIRMIKLRKFLWI